MLLGVCRLYAQADRRITVIRVAVLSSAAVFGMASPTRAFDIPTDSNWQVRLDTTVSYSDIFRVAPVYGPSEATNVNTDDGDRNLHSGLVSNRIDVLAEFDAIYRTSTGQDLFGFRASAAGWYDAVYNQDNGNSSPDTINHFSNANNKYSNETRDIEGRDLDLLDAFVFANPTIDGDSASIRVGRHTVLYGETLFFGANGIAFAQSPIDVIKALSLPDAQFKEIILPVGQTSGTIQLADNLSVGAYWQFEYRPNRLPGAGSYFSTIDALGDGNESLVLAQGTARSPLVVLQRDAAIAPSSGVDQGGLQVKWTPKGTSVEFGFYAAIYDDKNPQAYLNIAGLTPGVVPHPLPLGQFSAGNFQLVYPRHIQTYGVSFSTNIGDWNVGGEVSARVNTPLVSDLQIAAGGQRPDNDGNPLYAVGNTFHFNFSTVYVAPESRLWNTASVLAELAGNNALSVTKNPGALDPNTSATAIAMRAVFTPTYFQIFPSLDLSVPVGIGFNPAGESRSVPSFNGGTRLGGDASIGAQVSYRQVWHAGVNYTRYYGKPGSALNAQNHDTFTQSLADRDFISISLSRSF